MSLVENTEYISNLVIIITKINKEKLEFNIITD
jgi:hypothetical protein